ncbi:MAG: hypothetical protein ACR2JS_03710 [Candidatus Nanopelagicales bacterium]
MKTPKVFVVATAALCLTLVGLSSPSPAIAAEIGTGRAIIRIDAPTATVSKNPNGSFTLTIPRGSKGQFLGERPDANGKERLRVGNVSAKQLSSKWKDFKYTSAGAKATIAWDASKRSWKGANVSLSRPVVTSSGVTFEFTSKRGLPASLKDVTVNLQRAPQKKVRKTYDPEATVNLAGNMNFFAGFYDAGSVDVYLMDGTSHCWSYKFTEQGTATMPDESCAGIPQWGGVTTWGPLPPGCDGCFDDPSESQVSVKTNLQPSGEAAFTYSAVVITIDSW